MSIRRGVPIVPRLGDGHERRAGRVRPRCSVPIGIHAATRWKPDAVLPHGDPFLGRVAIGPGHPRHRDSLCGSILRVLAQEEKEIPVFRIEHDADVANAAKHEAIVGGAGDAIRRPFEDEAKVLPRPPAIDRSRRRC